MTEIPAAAIAIAALGLALRWEIRRRRLQSALEYIRAYRQGAEHQGDAFVVVGPDLDGVA